MRTCARRTPEALAERAGEGRPYVKWATATSLDRPSRVQEASGEAEAAGADAVDTPCPMLQALEASGNATCVLLAS